MIILYASYLSYPLKVSDRPESSIHELLFPEPAIDLITVVFCEMSENAAMEVIKRMKLKNYKVY